MKHMRRGQLKPVDASSRHELDRAHEHYRHRAFGHSKIESIVRYLGIEVDDAIEIVEKIDV